MLLCVLLCFWLVGWCCCGCGRGVACELHAEDFRVSIQNPPRVYVQNVPVCAGTTTHTVVQTQRNTGTDTDKKQKQKINLLLSEMVLAQLPPWWKLRSRRAEPRAPLRDQASHVRSRLAAGRVWWHPDIDSLSSASSSSPCSRLTFSRVTVLEVTFLQPHRKSILKTQEPVCASGH